MKFKLTFSQRFWLSLILTIPMLIQMVGMAFHWMMPGYNWLAFITTTLIMILGAWPYWKSGFASFKNHHATMNTLVAVGTGVAYFYSIFAMFTGRAVYFESAAFVTVFVMLGDMMEERMHYNAESALGKLASLQAKDAEKMVDGQWVKVPLDQVEPGDKLRVKPGGKIPVDGEILEGTTSIDEAMVTGESMPVVKKTGDSVIGSTINIDGTIVFKATKVGKDTMLAQIVDLVKKAQTSHAPIEDLTDKIANYFVPAVLIIAILTYVIWFGFIGASAVQAMLYAMSVVVIACPCALGLATPTALLVGTTRAAKMGVLLKNGQVLEKTRKIDTVVFDKTGTITKGKPEVTDVVGDLQQVLRVAASLEEGSEHPLAAAIVARAKEGQLAWPAAQDFKAISGKGVTGTVEGQTAFVCSPDLARQQNYELTQKAAALQKEAKTVVYVGMNGIIIGLIAMRDEPKPTSKAAIAALKKRGLTTVMLTGDHAEVAQAVAKQVGVDQVIAGVLPTQKAAEIEKLQEGGHQVAFVGDGINDAPALSTADVGIAMGSGTDVAIASGDIILVQNDLMGVHKALAVSQKTYQRIIINLFWSLIYNTIGIPIAAGLLAFIGWSLSPELAGLAMAFSSVSVVTSSLMLNKTKIVA